MNYKLFKLCFVEKEYFLACSVKWNFGANLLYIFPLYSSDIVQNAEKVLLITRFPTLKKLQSYSITYFIKNEIPDGIKRAVKVWADFPSIAIQFFLLQICLNKPRLTECKRLNVETSAEDCDRKNINSINLSSSSYLTKEIMFKVFRSAFNFQRFDDTSERLNLGLTEKFFVWRVSTF